MLSYFYISSTLFLFWLLARKIMHLAALIIIVTVLLSVLMVFLKMGFHDIFLTLLLKFSDFTSLALSFSHLISLVPACCIAPCLAVICFYSFCVCVNFKSNKQTKNYQNKTKLQWELTLLYTSCLDKPLYSATDFHVSRWEVG